MKYVLESSRPAKPPFDLERELNPQQRAVVEAPPGELLVLAGAGTGKTRTLTYRVARLIAAGCKPERTMLVTFTNRAAREMVARVEGLLGLDMRRCSAGTFHHVGHRLLRRHGEALGFGSDFGILDPEDGRELIGSVVAELGLSVLTAKRFPSAKLLITMISQASGSLCSVATIVDRRFPNFLDQLTLIDKIAIGFRERKRKLNLVDFDDLLALWLELLRDPKHAALGELLRTSYDHLLVDEYQDINAMQGALIDEMASRHRSLTCVGDDAQSIYSFRGADFAQIHDFRLRHVDAKVLPLTLNYRSTPEILALANRSIRHNREQHPKELQAMRQPGSLPAVIPLRDVMQQAELVAQRVLELHHEQTLPLSKMAVLYRNHAHSLELQVELTRRGIPFMVRSGLRFFEQAHIKDVVAYLRARENPRDGLAWLRLLRLWPGIGMRTAEKVAATLAGETLPGEPAPALPDLLSSVAERLAHEAEQSRGRAREALHRLAKLFEALDDPGQRSPGKAIRTVLAQHYSEYAERTFTNADARKEDLDNLASFAERWPDARDFLAELALVNGVSAENVIMADEPDDKLVLSTIHQAKGLEWPIVFVLWVADGRFPAAQSMRTPQDLEERRLFYVAVTRAADELHLLYPTIEEGRDGPSKLLRPSRFVAEIDHAPAVFERWEIEEVRRDDA